MRADIQSVNSITTLPHDCVGSIVKYITEDDKNKSPNLVSLSAWSRTCHSMREQLTPWMNPQEHGYRLIDQAADHRYPSVRTMNLVARFAAFLPAENLEKEIRIGCGLSTSRIVNELLMKARAGETMNPESQLAIALHLKDKGILDGINEADRTPDQKQLGINTVADILSICGIQIYESKRTKKKVFLAASLLNDGLKALSSLTKSLRTFGFLRMATSLKNEYSDSISQQFLDHSAWFIPDEWDAEFMASSAGGQCLESLSIFMGLPMPDSDVIEDAVTTLLNSYLNKRSATDPHWTTMTQEVFDLSLSLYRSLRLKNKPEKLVQQLTELGIFTKDELVIMDAADWSDMSSQTKARTEFLRLMQNASVQRAAEHQNLTN